MELYSNDFCNLELYDRFVIVTISEDILFTLDKANIIRKKLSSHFKTKNFLLISNRKNNHIVSEDIYKQGLLSNMKGLAIVSSEKTERDRAMIEQKLFDKSFAFFETIDEAKSWAEAYF